MRILIPAYLLALTVTAVSVAANAATMTSPGYTITAGRITSGGSNTGDPAGMAKSDIAIGQGVFIPATGSSSPEYVIKPVTLGILATGGACAVRSGDINCDGVVDIVDALVALKAGVGLVQLSNSDIVRGDVGPLVNNVAVGNGRIDIEDTMLILRKAVGLGW